MHELEKIINDSYNMKISNITAYRDMYIASAETGKKLIRVSALKPERIKFISDVKEHLADKGFTNTDRNVMTIEGRPYALLNDQPVYMTEFIDGRECNLDNKDETMNCARLLAQMHKASYCFKSSEDLNARSELYKLPQNFRKRLYEIKKLKKIAQRGKMKFDHMICESADYYYNIGEKALDMLMESDYGNLSRQAEKSGIISHHDFNHHNIYVKDSEMHVVNFEYCCFDIKAYDLVNLLRRKMRKCNWDIEEAVDILNEYGKIETISQSELEVMKIMLMFPQKFWRVINKYYNSRRSWSEKNYITRLQEVLDEKPYLEAFLEEFNKL